MEQPPKENRIRIEAPKASHPSLGPVGPGKEPLPFFFVVLLLAVFALSGLSLYLAFFST